MILIADSGGTGTDWSLIPSPLRTGGMKGGLVHTCGLNPLHGLPTSEELRRALITAGFPLPGREERENLSLFFYGAGCTSDQMPRMRAFLCETFGCASEQVCVQSDMVGAARAVQGDSPGLVAILGTGANACYWDGRELHPGPRSLGYVLGDEGSGAYIGRLLLRAILRGDDAALAAQFEQETGLTYPDILERVYRRPGAAAFLAALAPFCASHRQHPLVHEVLDRAFTHFAGELLMPLVAVWDCRSVGFVGSIARHFRPELAEALGRHGITISQVVARPIEALTDYHTRRRPHAGED